MKPASSDLARLGERFRERREGSERSGPCPDAERIWEAARDRCPPGELRDLVAHTSACPACATVWRLAREITSAERREAPARETLADRGSRVRSIRRIVPLAAAAILLLVAGLALLDRIGLGPGGEKAVYRSQARSAIESLLPEGKAVDPEDCLLRWSLDPAVEGVEYAVRVLDPDLRLLGSRERLTESELRVPTEWLEPLSPGSTFLWQVDAVLLDGRTIRSATFTTRVR